MPDTLPPVISAKVLMAAMQTQIAENYEAVATALGLTTIKPVKTWKLLSNANAFTSANLPAVLTVANGTDETPVKLADGRYRCRWSISALVYVRGDGFDETMALVTDWCAVLRGSVLRRSSLGVGASTTWAGEQYDEIPNNAVKGTLGGGSVEFSIQHDLAISIPALDAAITEQPVITTPILDGVGVEPNPYAWPSL